MLSTFSRCPTHVNFFSLNYMKSMLNDVLQPASGSVIKTEQGSHADETTYFNSFIKGFMRALRHSRFHKHCLFRSLLCF